MNQTKTIRLAGLARFGDEIRAFHTYGPSPLANVYSDVLATFPATKTGQKAADAFITAYGVTRGTFDVVDEFKK